MRRVLPLACAALLVGCGGSQPASTTTPVHHVNAYAVNVYFCSRLACAAGATRREERLVGARLRREPCVRRVVFVSKAEALAKMKRQFPQLFQQGMPSNPLPDSFVVTPAEPSCVAAIAADARAARWPGVQRIALKRRRH